MENNEDRAPVFRKSSHSGSANSNCVEVASTGDTILVRDSKAPEAGTLRFNLSEWRAFLAGVRQGEFDLA